MDPGSEPSAELLQEFISIVTRFGLPMPPSISEMMRALATLQGSLDALSPRYPIMDAAKAIAMDELRGDLGPDNLVHEAKLEAVRLAPILRRAPHHIDRIAGQLESGKFTVRVSLFSSEDDIKVLSRFINRALIVFIGAALGIVSAMLFRLGTGPALSDNFRLFDLLGFIGLFACAILIMRAVLEILRER